MQELKPLRGEIDRIDRAVVELLKERMEVSEKIALAKMEAGLPVQDVSREKEVLRNRESLMDDEALRPFIGRIFEEIMAMSRARQARAMGEEKHND
mgnify:FL=1